MSDILETRRIPYFPAEIMDIIIDLLHTDKATLSSCTLVSRSWLPRSRLHLFTRVQVFGFQTQFQPFIELLTQANGGPRLDPPISTTIKRLRLDGRDDSVFSSPEPLTTSMLKMLLCNLPNLLDLDVRGVILTWVAPGLSDTGDKVALPDLIHLNSLTLDAFTTASKDPSDFVSSLCFFSSIDVLRISSPLYMDIPEDPAAVAAHPSLLTTMPYFPSHLKISSIAVCDGECTPFILALLQKTASVETINNVDVVCRTRVHADALGSFLDNVGARIQNVSVDIVMLFQAASTLVAYASRTVQTVFLDILLDGSYVDLSRFNSVVQNMATEFIWLQSAIKQKSSRLCIRWNGLQRMVKRIEERVRFEEELCRLVQSHLSKLGADGMLSFASDVEDL
ncbi:hypothetical protein PHLCEN_2v13329 [Hermanssonia centrifuga]|uniref:F-box domain-containing protein n=1 Tax=Hermanssonia centrifuga TaxID=98765 RepID=A0A2R6NFL5_9APHY|nr:hypothetical protein PHLCEN_2v13329 [Hermanssonia centrifuga]